MKGNLWISSDSIGVNIKILSILILSWTYIKTRPPVKPTPTTTSFVQKGQLILPSFNSWAVFSKFCAQQFIKILSLGFTYKNIQAPNNTGDSYDMKGHWHEQFFSLVGRHAQTLPVAEMGQVRLHIKPVMA